MPKSDALRAYVITLREGRDLSREEVALGAGLKPRAYAAWENGETESMKIDVAQAIIRFLGGSWSHLERMDQIGPAEAEALAGRWLKMAPEDIEAAEQSARQKARIIALKEDDPAKLDDVLREMRDLGRVDPATIDYIKGILDGRRSR